MDNNRGDGAMWCDLIDPEQNLFRYDGEDILMLHNDQWVELPGRSVVERWPYASDLMTPIQITERMGLGSAMPTSTTMETYRLSRELLYPRGRQTLDFEYNHAAAIGADMVREGEEVIRNHRYGGRGGFNGELRTRR